MMRRFLNSTAIRCIDTDSLLSISQKLRSSGGYAYKQKIVQDRDSDDVIRKSSNFLFAGSIGKKKERKCKRSSKLDSHFGYVSVFSCFLYLSLNGGGRRW